MRASIAKRDEEIEHLRAELAKKEEQRLTLARGNTNLQRRIEELEKGDLQTFDEMCHHYGKLSDQFFEQRDRIEELKEELTDARAEIIRMQSETRREIEERIAQHVQNGAIHGDGGEIIGWRTCDCHACTSIGRSPRGPDFRYDDAWEKRGSL